MNDLLVVLSQDDWVDAYVDGVRVAYGHSFHYAHLLEILGNHFVSDVVTFSIDGKTIKCLENWNMTDVFGTTYYTLPDEMPKETFYELVAHFSDENATWYKIAVAFSDL